MRGNLTGAMESGDGLIEKAAKARELAGYLEVGPGDSGRVDGSVEDACAEEALAVRMRVGRRKPPLQDAGLLGAQVNDKPQNAAAFEGKTRAASVLSAHVRALA